MSEQIDLGDVLYADALDRMADWEEKYGNQQISDIKRSSAEVIRTVPGAGKEMRRIALELEESLFYGPKGKPK